MSAVGPSATPSARSGRARRSPRAAWVAVLRTGLLAVCAITGVAVLTAAALSAWEREASAPALEGSPTRLMGLRVVGHDDKGRPFELTAVSAKRDPDAPDKVELEQPVFVIEEGGEGRTRVSASAGRYDEEDGKLALSGGVDYSGARGVFKSSASVIDTRTGEVAGSSAIRASTPTVTVEGDSYEASERGERVVVRGRVRGRLTPN
jgi:lipopolysaccharide export system protein LptC